MADSTIWKYPLAATETVVDAPMGAIPLTVQTQEGSPCLWMAIPDPDAEKEERVFVMCGTGLPISSAECLDYVATFQQPDATFQQPELGLVWHVFERLGDA